MTTKFKPGDKVRCIIFDNYTKNLNSNTIYNIAEIYSFMYEIYIELEEIPISNFRASNFILDIKTSRKQKLNKLYASKI